MIFQLSIKGSNRFDSIMELVHDFLGTMKDDMSRKLILDRPGVQQLSHRHPQPGTSGYQQKRTHQDNNDDKKEHDQTPEEIANQVIKNAELARASIFEVLGKLDHLSNPAHFNGDFKVPNEFVHSMLVDKNTCQWHRT